MLQPTAQGCNYTANRPNSTLIVALTDDSDGLILEINLIESKVYSLAAAQLGSVENGKESGVAHSELGLLIGKANLKHFYQILLPRHYRQRYNADEIALAGQSRIKPL